MAQVSTSNFKTIGEMISANRLQPDRVIDLDLYLSCKNGNGLTDNDIATIRNYLGSSLADPIRRKIEALKEQGPSQPIGLLLHIIGLSGSQYPASADRLFSAVEGALTDAKILGEGVTLLTDWGSRSDFSLCATSELVTPNQGTWLNFRYVVRAPREREVEPAAAQMEPTFDGLMKHLNGCFNLGEAPLPCYIDRTIIGIIETASARELDSLANVLLRTAETQKFKGSAAFTPAAISMLNNAAWVARVRHYKFGPV